MVSPEKTNWLSDYPLIDSAFSDQNPLPLGRLTTSMVQLVSGQYNGECKCHSDTVNQIGSSSDSSSSRRALHSCSYIQKSIFNGFSSQIQSGQDDMQQMRLESIKSWKRLINVSNQHIPVASSGPSPWPRRKRRCLKSEKKKRKKSLDLNETQFTRLDELLTRTQLNSEFLLEKMEDIALSGKLSQKTEPVKKVVDAKETPSLNTTMKSSKSNAESQL